MRFSAASSLWMLSGLLSAADGSPTPADDLVVKTSSGQITGFINSTYPDVRQFLGIRYAKPAVRKLRFAPPERYTSNEPFVANKTPDACPQFISSMRTIINEAVTEYNNFAPISEDCLSLSVWAPNDMKKGDKLPVFIWIHGGGLQTGSSSVPLQQPPAWIQRSKGHIVVAIQYRLNIFGFPNAAGLKQSNLGFMDQRMGIEWVRDNIEAFGGDLNRLVLWGQSSGAASTDVQNFAFPKDPIVKAFIQNSGNVLIPPATGLAISDPAHSNFSFVARELGCPPVPEAELACMRTQSTKRIVDFLANYTDSMKQPALDFLATTDGKWVFSNYTERYAKGLFSDRPAIFGSNLREGNIMVPFPKDPIHMGVNDTLSEKLTLALFQCPAAHSAGFRAAAKRKTYRYIYSGNFTDISPYFWSGAYHMTELPQIFGTRGEFNAAASEYEVKTSDGMQDLWLGFAQNLDDPTKAGWQEASGGKMLMLGAPGGPDIQVIDEMVVDDPCKQAKL
ncbi:carboxylesterase [Colletotrichum karsti]|uniref:Carboxylic ester hydrolase n=1 Tax=Colletotrichum karsti TaxID=1095194 RepID=A0A9P6IDF3_9PEZI|nr:carboxylesterase [Colletotrichum karsti]KAF9881528.1 carboxylesterase [Colletotrichum karsti]